MTGKRACGTPSRGPSSVSGEESYPPEEVWAIARAHKRRTAQKRREKMGSSVA